MVVGTGLSLSAGLATELSDLAERARQSVVEVSDGRGAGAGTIWSSDGLIVTNHHVVPGPRARIMTANGSTHDAEVIHRLPDRDLAIMQSSVTQPDILPVGDPSALRPGALVMAVGHPFGITGAISLGIFSGIGPIEQWRGRHFREALLANIELRPGNSGGPLLTMAGEVIGINSMVLGTGTALAVPSTVVERLLSWRHPHRLDISAGMIVTPAVLAERFGIEQELLTIVLNVIPGGAAAAAGLLPGDMLLTINGHPLEEPGDITLALADTPVGGAASLRLIRGGKIQEMTLRLTDNTP